MAPRARVLAWRQSPASPSVTMQWRRSMRPMDGPDTEPPVRFRILFVRRAATPTASPQHSVLVTTAYTSIPQTPHTESRAIEGCFAALNRCQLYRRHRRHRHLLRLRCHLRHLLRRHPLFHHCGRGLPCAPSRLPTLRDGSTCVHRQFPSARAQLTTTWTLALPSAHRSAPCAIPMRVMRPFE